MKPPLVTSLGGGTWHSSNPMAAFIDSNGVILAIEQGQATFTFTSLQSGCSSNPTRSFLINPIPVVTIAGPASICLGSTTQLYPISGGSWVSSNPSVASVNNAGLVSGLTIGQSYFLFSDAASGCQAEINGPIAVYDKPTVNISGPLSICAGTTSSVNPSSGGYWQSTQPSVATINNTGIITGVSAGTARFIFTEEGSGCTSDTSLAITIDPRPSVNISGSSFICVGALTSLTPATGGNWTSSNPTIATVTSGGLVTGLDQGLVSFYFTEDGGCQSLPTPNVTVNSKPTVSLTGSSLLCPGDQTYLNPSSGGSWSSSNNTVASVDNNGLVTALNAGSAKFVFIETASGCVSDSSTTVSVHNHPFTTVTGPSQICEGATTTIVPTVGGVWASSDTAIATVNNIGVVTGHSGGTANFYFTNVATGCTSIIPLSIVVNNKPEAILPQQTICEGETLEFPITENGTWISMSPGNISVSAGKMVTGLNAGNAVFTFISSITGCASEYTAPMVVNARPYTQITGFAEICEGSSTELSPSTGGTWVSNNPAIATISNEGIVQAIGIGQATFAFTDSSTGCSSLSLPNTITVTQGITLSITGSSEVCLGHKIQLSTTASGTWASMNEKIGTIDNNGYVTGFAPGKVGFIFTEIGTGCKASLPADAVTVVNCIDPDFNVTLSSIGVSGNVATNDEAPLGTTYASQIITLEKPTGSIDVLTMATDGSYQFEADLPGKYIYVVPVCVPPITYSCPKSLLTITVVDFENVNQTTVANTDIVTNDADEPINIKSSQNDRCVSGYGCHTDSSSVLVTSPPQHGSTLINNDGTISYTPDSGHMGLDTIIYQICVNGDSTNCSESEIIITTNSPSSINSAVAADDFFAMVMGGSLTASVVLNDNDPEGDSLFVDAVGSMTNPVNITQGAYYITSSGILTFIPTSTFTGPVDIVYKICDNNSDTYCASATAHILVLEPMSLKIRVYLEGALIENGNAVTATGRPLMRDNLRINPVTGVNMIPIRDPYKFSTEWVNVTSFYNHVQPGVTTQFDEILDSATVFSVTGQNAIVDWVFVEIRHKNDNTNIISTRSGLLQRDGDVVDLDGVNSLVFPGLTLDSFYVVVRHRSHLGSMSGLVSKNQLVDFTSPNTPLFDFGTRLNNGFDYTGLAQNGSVKYGYNALWAGDFNGDGKLKFTNPSDDINVLYFDLLFHPQNPNTNSNFNFGYGYYQGDVNMNGKIKFDNPNDDKNLLYAQILFYNLNNEFMSNYNFFIQQVP
ncbi:MAG: Ig-like domain-containing protein [Saprospiraceae bacterium]|nr:Ig-like domain-containing protein [Saprospiraceae bacterium]